MFKLIKSHYKKQWLSFLTVAVFILLSTMMMSIGITIADESKTYYDKKAETQNLADYSVRLWHEYKHESADYINKFMKDIVINDSMVEEYEITSSMGLVMEGVGGQDVMPYDESLKISKTLPEKEMNAKNGIYANSFAKMRLGAKIGDKITLSSPHKKKEFVVIGFYEELMYAYQSMIIMPQDAYNEFYDDVVKYRTTAENVDENSTPYFTDTVINVKASDSRYLDNLIANVTENYAPMFALMGVTPGYGIWSRVFVRDNIMSFANILSAVLIVFSIIIMIVSIIIIRFSLVSYIEDDIKNLGILKGLGYNNANLRKTMITEYMGIGVLASAIGAGLSVILTPIFSGIIGKTVDLTWAAVPSAWAIVLAVIVPLAVTALFVWLLSRRVNNVTPLNALRQGIETHNFKRNFLPLQKFDKCTNLVLSYKGILNQALRYVSVGVVVLVISFVSVFAVMLHYNMNVDNTAFAALTGAEKGDAMVAGYSSPDKSWEEMEEIDHISYIGYDSSIKVTHTNPTTNRQVKLYPRFFFVKDFKQSTINVLYKGSYPISGGEAMITKSAADKLGVKIGDTIKSENAWSNLSTEYRVVGLCQNMSFPDGIYVNEEGAHAIVGEIDNLYYDKYIYLKDGVDYDAFMAKLIEILDGRASAIYDREECSSVFITPALKDGAMILTIAMDAITLIAVAMVLLFILKLKIIRERKNIAISKALGATTKDVIIQTTVGVVSVIAVFALLGGLLGAALTGVMMKLVLSSYSIMVVKLVIPWGIVFGMILGITAFTLLVAVLIALRTKLISPRSLIAAG